MEIIRLSYLLTCASQLRAKHVPQLKKRAVSQDLVTYLMILTAFCLVYTN